MDTIYNAAVFYLLLTFFAILGVLARIGLTRLTSFEGDAFGGVLWANLAGSLIMGFLNGDRASAGENNILFGRLLQKNSIHRGGQKSNRQYNALADVPLYAGLATGLCGSITSFSSFELILFELSANTSTNNGSSNKYGNSGYGVMMFLSYLILTMSVSIGGYRTGQHMTHLFIQKEPDQSRRDHEAIVTTGSKESIFIISEKLEGPIEAALAALGLAGWITTLVLAIVQPHGWRYWCLSCVFAPFGVFARYWCSKHLNSILKPKFMLGTFTANMLATLVIAILVLLQRGNSVGLTGTQHSVLAALQDGFCGNFSTISSFVAELVGFKRLKHAYVYAGVSIFTGFALLVLILGSYTWTEGVH